MEKPQYLYKNAASCFSINGFIAWVPLISTCGVGMVAL